MGIIMIIMIMMGSLAPFVIIIIWHFILNSFLSWLTDFSDGEEEIIILIFVDQ